MQALSNPGRLAIVHELLAGPWPFGAGLPWRVRLKFPKRRGRTTLKSWRCWHHFHLGREGTECMTSLRKTELNKHFPGLLKLLSAGQTIIRKGAEKTRKI